MAVRSSANPNFIDCPECEDEFGDLVEILDDCDEDDIHKELGDWGYNFTDSNPVVVTLPCGDAVVFRWDSGMGNITVADCG